ncbi:MAG: hypothetical protein LBR95_01795 [Azoarcus sp.]|nr:hypothetical protein [Azoarcus sp.]
MSTIMKIIAASVAALAVTACGNPKDANKGNFSKAIQAYLDTKPVFCPHFPKVLEKNGWSKNTEREVDALVDAGLLSTRDTEVKAIFGEKMLPATEYQVTDLGKQYLAKEGNDSERLGRLCTGKYKLTGIDNFTEPGPVPFSSVTASQVNFRYEITDLAEWTKSEKVRSAYASTFKEFEKNQDKAMLVLTNDGWIHERLFRR